MTRALAILLASDPARGLLRHRASARPNSPCRGRPGHHCRHSPLRLARAEPRSSRPDPIRRCPGLRSPSATGHLLRAAGADRRAADGVDQRGHRSGDLSPSGSMPRPAGRCCRMQLSGNGQTFDVPILAVDANGKLTGGLYDVNSSGQLARVARPPFPRARPPPAPSRSRRRCPTR